MKLEDKTALISGGSSGLGLATTKMLLSKGAKVHILARGEGRLEEVEKELASDNLSVHQGDVTNVDDVERVLEEIGDIDILVNNAGVFANGRVEDHDPEEIEIVLDVNLKGLILLTNRVINRQGRDKDLVVINISSTSGVKAKAESSVYCASKWGVRGFTDSLKEELKSSGVKVIGLYPGGMRTSLFDKAKKKPDMETYMDPADVAKVLVSILEDLDKVQVDHVVVNRPG